MHRLNRVFVPDNVLSDDIGNVLLVKTPRSRKAATSVFANSEPSIDFVDYSVGDDVVECREFVERKLRRGRHGCAVVGSVGREEGVLQNVVSCRRRVVVGFCG